MLRARSVRPSQIGPCAFIGAAQRAIVDELGADRGDAAGALQRLAPHQHAAAGRRRGARFFGSFTQAKGKSIWKKKTKAGIR